MILIVIELTQEIVKQSISGYESSSVSREPVIDFDITFKFL